MYGSLPKEYELYVRTQPEYLRPYIEGEDEERLVIHESWRKLGCPQKGDMIKKDDYTNQEILIPEHIIKWRYFGPVY